MGCFVRGYKNCMGRFLRGGKLMRDVLSGVSKNGMGCFVIHSCYIQIPKSNGLLVPEKKRFKSFFTIYRHGGHLSHVTITICTSFS